MLEIQYDDRCAPSVMRMQAKLARHMFKGLVERNSLTMTMPSRKHLKQNISGYAEWVKQRLGEGYQGFLMTFMFNSLSGNIRSINDQMQKQIENVYASFLTRLYRKPNAFGVNQPVLIGCPDFPVPKYEKKTLNDIVTNEGLHHHGILLIAPGSNRLKVSIPQHFTDNQSYYLSDTVLNRIDIRPITHDIDGLTDYTLKGLKRNRLPDDEALLILPKSTREVSVRPYRSKSED